MPHDDENLFKWLCGKIQNDCVLKVLDVSLKRFTVFWLSWILYVSIKIPEIQAESI